jgi:hypothetical protein
VQRLARLREPWRVVAEEDGIAVRDANGVLLVQLSRRGGSTDRALRRNDDPLSEAEAAELARLIALLPVLSRRPRY